MASLDRRRFLSLTGGAVVASAVGATGFTPFADAFAAAQGTTDSSARTLVVIDLQGGNDALNTFVPQSGIYRDLRPTVAIPEDSLLTFRRLNYGVHPSLASLQRFWDRGQLTAIYGVGIEGQGRSHFVAQDTWRTARPGRPAQSGWIGRWLEAQPTPEPVPLRAVAIGQSLLASRGEFFQPVGVASLQGIEVTARRIADTVAAMGVGAGSDLFGQVQAAAPRTMNAIDDLKDLIGDIDLTIEADPDADPALFDATTSIIQGNAGAEIIYLTVNGFDTHAAQPQRHEALLKVVADGLVKMFDSLAESGHAANTLAMVVSEFGRRVAQNGSAGTDHGRGGISFLVGPPVRGRRLIGEPDLNDLIDGDLRITTDARMMYDSALRWLGATSDQVIEVLGDEWRNVSLLDS